MMAEFFQRDMRLVADGFLRGKVELSREFQRWKNGDGGSGGDLACLGGKVAQANMHPVLLEVSLIQLVPDRIERWAKMVLPYKIQILRFGHDLFQAFE